MPVKDVNARIYNNEKPSLTGDDNYCHLGVGAGT